MSWNKEKVINLAKKRKYNEALERLLQAEIDDKSIINADFLVLKGVLIMLSDIGNFELKDAEDNFLKALELEPENINALEETYHYYADVMDNETKARKYKKRLETCIEQKEMQLKSIKNSMNRKKSFNEYIR